MTRRFVYLSLAIYFWAACLVCLGALVFELIHPDDIYPSYEDRGDVEFGILTVASLFGAVGLAFTNKL